MPCTAVPGTAAIVAARGRGVVSPAGSWLLIVSLSSALATCKATTRENTSPRLSRLCSACSPLRSYTSSSCSLGSALSTARCVRLAFCCSHAHLHYDLPPRLRRSRALKSISDAFGCSHPRPRAAPRLAVPDGTQRDRLPAKRQAPSQLTEYSNAGALGRAPSTERPGAQEPNRDAPRAPRARP
eukprot:scaffold74354_cov37-Phaeocystis_antarctica.AAC.1